MDTIHSYSIWILIFYIKFLKITADNYTSQRYNHQIMSNGNEKEKTYHVYFNNRIFFFLENR